MILSQHLLMRPSETNHPYLAVTYISRFSNFTIGETGASWSENCIFFLDAEIIIRLLVLFSHCVTSIIIFLTYSIVFHSENDRF